MEQCVSDYFTISNGVKQGVVLSPVLFSIYLDQLRHLGMGCYMNGLFTGVFMYADNITLLAPSRASLWYLCWKSVRVLR